MKGIGLDGTVTEVRFDASRITYVLFGEIVFILRNEEFLLIFNIYFFLNTWNCFRESISEAFWWVGKNCEYENMRNMSLTVSFPYLQLLQS